MALSKMAFTGFQRYQKRRKNLSVVLIGSVFLVAFFISFITTVNGNLQEFWVNNFVGGDIIVRQDYPNFDLFNPAPPDYYFSFQKFLGVNPHLVRQVAPHLRIGALLESKKSENSISCLITGIDAAKEQKLNPNISTLEGEYITPGKSEIMLPESLAANLNLKIGDQVVIFLITKEGYLNFDLLTLTGYLNLSLAEQEFGQYKAYVPIEKLRELTLTGSDTVSELIYKNNQGVLARGAKGRYRIIKGLTSFSIVRSIYLAFCFLEVVILLLVFAIAFNSIYQNIILANMEREKEIGVYLTCGATPFWIRKLMLLELILYTCFCVIAGSLFAFLVIQGINALGIYPIDNSTQLLMSSSHFVMRMDLPIFIYTLFIMVLLVISAGIKPIWKATGNTRVINLFK